MSPPPVIQNPYVNGSYYDFTVMKFRVGPTRYFGIQDIDYKNTGTFGKARGTGPYVRGRGRGIVDSDGSFTMYLGEWDTFIQALLLQGAALGMINPGYMEVPFGISISYGKSALDMRTDEIVGARIKSDDYSHKEGSDLLVVKAELDILQVIINGVQAMSDAPFGVGSLVGAGG
jgi:hypothetical protein